MHRQILPFLAVAGLLVQAVFGAVSPVAVLCISNHLHGCHEAIVQENCGEDACCHVSVTTSENNRPDVGISAPCEDDCLECVDIALPDDVIWTDGRHDVLPDQQPVAIHSFLGVHQPRTAPRARLAPHGIGAPALLACPHAPIVRTTRLLI